MTSAAKHMTHGGRELIAFRIGGQEFCVNIMSIREIRGWTPATPMPRAPAYVLGVINLRGAVLPIVDLSQRLGMKPAEPTIRHVIIVTQAGSRVVGLLVDAVSDILTVSDENLQPMPDITTDMERNFAKGILSVEGRMICLMELDAVFPNIESIAA